MAQHATTAFRLIGSALLLAGSTAGFATAQVATSANAQQGPSAPASSAVKVACRASSRAGPGVTKASRPGDLTTFELGHRLGETEDEGLEGARGLEGGLAG